MKITGLSPLLSPAIPAIPANPAIPATPAIPVTALKISSLHHQLLNTQNLTIVIQHLGEVQPGYESHQRNGMDIGKSREGPLVQKLTGHA